MNLAHFNSCINLRERVVKIKIALSDFGINNITYMYRYILYNGANRQWFSIFFGFTTQLNSYFFMILFFFPRNV